MFESYYKPWVEGAIDDVTMAHIVAAQRNLGVRTLGRSRAAMVKESKEADYWLKAAAKLAEIGRARHGKESWWSEEAEMAFVARGLERHRNWLKGKR